MLDADPAPELHGGPACILQGLHDLGFGTDSNYGEAAAVALVQCFRCFFDRLHAPAGGVVERRGQGHVRHGQRYG